MVLTPSQRSFQEFWAERKACIPGGDVLTPSQLQSGHSDHCEQASGCQAEASCLKRQARR